MKNNAWQDQHESMLRKRILHNGLSTPSPMLLEIEIRVQKERLKALTRSLVRECLAIALGVLVGYLIWGPS